MWSRETKECLLLTKYSIVAIRKLQSSEADLAKQNDRQKQQTSEAEEIIPTAQHILDNYEHLTALEKNNLWKIVLEKITIYRPPDGEFSIHLYPNIPK